MEGITSDNVKLEDKDDLNSAKDDLENALDSFSGNYTEAEKTALEEKLDRINSALDSIGNVEKTEEVIGSLPDKVNPDDAYAEKLINDAKKQYDALTDHEKSLVSEAAKAKLESLLDDLKDYKIIKGDGSIWTKGTESGIEFTANGAYSKFTGIEVDGEAVNEANYTAVSAVASMTLTISAISSGGCCRSASIITAKSPREARSPAYMAASLPKLRLNEIYLSSV